MPEHPEVLTIVDQLNLYFTNRTISSIYMVSSSVKFNRALSEMTKFLPLKIQKISCKGKLIIFEFVEEESKGENKKEENKKSKSVKYLCNTLGDTGRWGIDYKLGIYKYLKYVFEMKDDSNFPKYLFYDDKLGRGSLTFVKDNKTYLSKLNTRNLGFIGEEILKFKDFISNWNKISSSKKESLTIAELLIDQKLLCSGIGNYLLAEILYATKINPWKKLTDITQKDLETIYIQSKRILSLSYKNGGMSFSDYIDVNGDKGKFIEHLEVYQQEKTSKGEKVRHKKGSHGRTIWYVDSQV